MERLTKDCSWMRVVREVSAQLVRKEFGSPEIRLVGWEESAKKNWRRGGEKGPRGTNLKIR